MNPEGDLVDILFKHDRDASCVRHSFHGIFDQVRQHRVAQHLSPQHAQYVTISHGPPMQQHREGEVFGFDESLELGNNVKQHVLTVEKPYFCFPPPRSTPC